MQVENEDLSLRRIVQVFELNRRLTCFTVIPFLEFARGTRRFSYQTGMANRLNVRTIGCYIEACFEVGGRRSTGGRESIGTQIPACYVYLAIIRDRYHVVSLNI